MIFNTVLTIHNSINVPKKKSNVGKFLTFTLILPASGIVIVVDFVDP